MNNDANLEDAKGRFALEKVHHIRHSMDGQIREIVRTVDGAAVGGCIDRLFLISEGTSWLIVGNHVDRGLCRLGF